MMVGDVERFWSKVDKSEGSDACWPWQGVRNPKGYGQFRCNGQMRQAHRWILGVLRGADLRWDDELKEEACHHCDNPSCCNPAHLYVGNHAQNMQDCLQRGRNPQATKMHCPQGHEYTEENTSWTPKKGRSCKTCARERAAARRAKAKESEPPKDPNRCKNGHLWTQETTYWHESGRYCKTCNSESRKRNRQRRKAGGVT